MNPPPDMPRLVHWRLPGAAAPRAEPLPMSKPELARRGWDQCDAILVTGDAYVDHPSFGVALIGRLLEWLGYRVGILAQPDVNRPDDFAALGPPALFWGVTAGNVDSDLARLTVMRKARRDDPYAPDGKAGRRPRHATVAYTARARQAFPGVPVILGGVEASLRRFAYYDFWSDAVRRSILFDAKADVLAFGMAELALAELAWRLRHGRPLAGVRGTAAIARERPDAAVILPGFEALSEKGEAGRSAFLDMARLLARHAGSLERRALAQAHGDRWLVAQPPARPLATAEMDQLYALPFTRLPHPAYGRRRIPAFEMIRDSITVHRGCYGGCSFCAIAAHQGPAISSRSEAGVLAEIRRLAARPGFHGTISDLGGPSANMYGTRCRRGREGCPDRSCLFPDVCPNLDADARPWLRLLDQAARVPGVRHVFASSGIRFDLFLLPENQACLEPLLRHHLGGRLNLAPEHASDRVLAAMRKPPRRVYEDFLALVERVAARLGKRVPRREYYISGHPGCGLEDMAELVRALRREGLEPEQVQDFYPAPLTLAAAMYVAGRDPLTGAALAVARSDRDKAGQRALLLGRAPGVARRHVRGRKPANSLARPRHA